MLIRITERLVGQVMRCEVNTYGELCCLCLQMPFGAQDLSSNNLQECEKMTAMEVSESTVTTTERMNKDSKPSKASLFTIEYLMKPSVGPPKSSASSLNSCTYEASRWENCEEH